MFQELTNCETQESNPIQFPSLDLGDEVGLRPWAIEGIRQRLWHSIQHGVGPRLGLEPGAEDSLSMALADPQRDQVLRY